MLIDSNPCGRFHNLRKSLKIRVAICKHSRSAAGAWVWVKLSYISSCDGDGDSDCCWLLIMANGKVISHVAKIYGFHLLESHVEAAAASQTPQNVAAVRSKRSSSNISGSNISSSSSSNTRRRLRRTNCHSH